MTDTAADTTEDEKQLSRKRELADYEMTFPGVPKGPGWRFSVASVALAVPWCAGKTGRRRRITLP